jgi:hypothetical protein
MIAFLILLLLLAIFALIYIYVYLPKKKSPVDKSIQPRDRSCLIYKMSQLPPNVRAELMAGKPVNTVKGLTLPASFDARQKWPGLITNPLDQESCGSCWAFSSATNMSDRWRIAYPTSSDDLLQVIQKYYPNYPDTSEVYSVLNNISPYQLVTCNICNTLKLTHPQTSNFLAKGAPYCDQGCQGGIIANVFDYLVEVGANSIIATNPTPCNPNNTATCVCDFTTSHTVYKGKSNNPVVGPTDTNAIKRQKIMEEVYTNGPVTVAYDVYQSFYDFYDPTKNPSYSPTGVYTANDKPPNDTLVGGHAVDIIGWGTDTTTGVFYWLIRNSWGITWGDQGFFRIQYDIDGVMDDVWRIIV